jgi:hypothetical protein
LMALRVSLIILTVEKCSLSSLFNIEDLERLSMHPAPRKTSIMPIFHFLHFLLDVRKAAVNVLMNHCDGITGIDAMIERLRKTMDFGEMKQIVSKLEAIYEATDLTLKLPIISSTDSLHNIATSLILLSQVPKRQSFK